MTIYLLKSRDGVVAYDSYDGFVIRASSETEAREIAQKNGADEIEDWGANYQHRKSVPFWTDPKFSSCEAIESAPDEDGVILGSFNAG